MHSVRTGHQPTRKLRAETCANLHLTISAHKTHCRSVPRETRNCNGDCAYANGFTFLAEGIDVVILRTPVTNAVMSVWCPDRLWRPVIEWVQGTFCPRENGPGRESDRSPLSTSDLNEYLQLYFSFSIHFHGDRGSTVVKVLCYKSEGRWFDPSWCQWIFH